MFLAITNKPNKHLTRILIVSEEFIVKWRKLRTDNPTPYLCQKLTQAHVRPTSGATFRFQVSKKT
jgi:hypothetical protein